MCKEAHRKLFENGGPVLLGVVSCTRSIGSNGQALAFIAVYQIEQSETAYGRYESEARSEYQNTELKTVKLCQKGGEHPWGYYERTESHCFYFLHRHLVARSARKISLFRLSSFPFPTRLQGHRVPQSR